MTHAAFKLEDAGFTREQIDALTEFLTGSVATKEDIVRLEGKIVGLEGEMKTLGADLEGKIVGLEGKMKTMGADLEGEMKTMGAHLKGEINTVKWMFGVLVVVNMAAALKLFLG